MPKGRILFADNNRDFLDTRCEFLEDAGFQTVRAYTMDEARHIMSQARVHLAVLDIRLANDDDERDVSGLTLAKEPAFRLLPKIMLTGFPSYEAARDALGPGLDSPPAAVGFLSKQEGPDRMVQAVERAFEQHVRINFDLRICRDEHGCLSFLGLLDPTVPDQYLCDRAGDVEDLFRKLFYEKTHLTLGRLFWHRAGRVCLSAFAFSAKGEMEPLLVTCGLKEPMERERAAFERYAPTGNAGAALETEAETMRFTARAYALPKEVDLEQVRTFGEFYRASDLGQIKNTLHSLVQTSLAAWHESAAPAEGFESLAQWYQQRLGLKPESVEREELLGRLGRLAEEVKPRTGSQVEMTADQGVVRFPNETTVTVGQPVACLDKPLPSRQPVTWQISPGTLTADNILVDQKGSAWLTDFADAGPAPSLWDLSSLDAMIRFTLVESTDALGFHEFEERLAGPLRLDDFLDADNLEAPFRKGLGALEALRRHAPAESLVPYCEGVFFLTMRALADCDPDCRHTPRAVAQLAHQLIAAGMIWDAANEAARNPTALRPKPAIPQIVMDADARTNQVVVRGKSVALTPTEFKVLWYLYRAAGAVRSRRLILEEGLGEKPTRKGDEQGPLNTIIDRLRKKIEPDPSHPRYVITAKGEGYKLSVEGEGGS